MKKISTHQTNMHLVKYPQTINWNINKTTRRNNKLYYHNRFKTLSVIDNPHMSLCQEPFSKWLLNESNFKDVGVPVHSNDSRDSHDSREKHELITAVWSPLANPNFLWKVPKGNLGVSLLKVSTKYFRYQCPPKEVGGVGERLNCNGQGKQEGNVNISWTFTPKYLLNT